MANVDVAVSFKRGTAITQDRISAIGDAGFEVVRVLSAISAVYASGDPEAVESLRRIEGVADVRTAGRYQLPPMDEDVPQ